MAVEKTNIPPSVAQPIAIRAHNQPGFIEQFGVYLNTERGCARNTTEAYFSDLQHFAEWLAEGWHGNPPSTIEKADRYRIQKYLGELLTHGASPKTVGRKLYCLRRFYVFLLDEEVVTKNPAAAIQMPKVEVKVMSAITLEDLEKMVISLGASPLDIRDRAMLLLLYASGLRVSELIALKRQDLDLENGVVRVWSGKGAKDGIAPLNRVAIAALNEYLNVRPQLERSSSPFVFLGRYGTQLTRQEIYLRVTEISMRALGRRISPHRLRAGCATALLEGGSDIRDTQKILRHASIDTTQRYLDLNLGFMRQAYYRSHPRARRGASSQ